MATLAPPKLKAPGEQPEVGKNAGLASPQLMTAPDVRQSEGITKGNPVPPGAPPPPNQNQTAAAPPSPAPTIATEQKPEAPSAAPPQTKASASGVTSGAPPQQRVAETVPVTTGAPPGVPNTTPTFAPPPAAPVPTLKSVVGTNAAEEEFNQAKAEYERKTAEAAYNYNGNPASATARAQLSAEGGLRRSTANRGAAGTINSSLYGEDKGLISNTYGRNLTEALDTYNKAVREAGDAMSKAQIAWSRAQEEKRREEAEKAQKLEPTTPVANPAPPQVGGSIVGAGTPIPGVPNPPQHGAPPHAGWIWTPSGGGGWVPPNTKVVRTY